ncbi:MAG: 2OG-Fe(II) oxygenase, partial [Pseudomonadota bacterium]|nr:2OG-Fe(II) oxygenase [Pseudomonadota bacterium]
NEVAIQIENEFPNYNDSIWHVYNNAIENKKVSNNWNFFPETTYKVFSLLNSDEFTSLLSRNIFNSMELFSDPGLNGGGWHIHRNGGKLNPHLDYSLHPKLKLERKLNIIIYVNSNWDNKWGGHLGLWNNKSSKQPGKLIKSVEPKFNRAIIFNTAQNSWHGLSSPIECPQNEFRKSLAIYYLCKSNEETNQRGKALFAPTVDQKSDPEVIELIKNRASVEKASSVYNNKK